MSIPIRYARTDEIGVPFAVTVDFKALEDGSVTVRERDSTSQVGGRGCGGRSHAHACMHARCERMFVNGGGVC
jgi:hypothetical protein